MGKTRQPEAKKQPAESAGSLRRVVRFVAVYLVGLVVLVALLAALVMVGWGSVKLFQASSRQLREIRLLFRRASSLAPTGVTGGKPPF